MIYISKATGIGERFYGFCAQPQAGLLQGVREEAISARATGSRGGYGGRGSPFSSSTRQADQCGSHPTGFSGGTRHLGSCQGPSCET